MQLNDYGWRMQDLSGYAKTQMGAPLDLSLIPKNEYMGLARWRITKHGSRKIIIWDGLVHIYDKVVISPTVKNYVGGNFYLKTHKVVAKLMKEYFGEELK